MSFKTFDQIGEGDFVRLKNGRTGIATLNPSHVEKGAKFAVKLLHHGKYCDGFTGGLLHYIEGIGIPLHETQAEDFEIIDAVGKYVPPYAFKVGDHGKTTKGVRYVIYHRDEQVQAKGRVFAILVKSDGVSLDRLAYNADGSPQGIGVNDYGSLLPPTEDNEA